MALISETALETEVGICGDEERHCQEVAIDSLVLAHAVEQQAQTDGRQLGCDERRSRPVEDTSEV